MGVDDVLWADWGAAFSVILDSCRINYKPWYNRENTQSRLESILMTWFHYSFAMCLWAQNLIYLNLFPHILNGNKILLKRVIIIQYKSILKMTNVSAYNNCYCNIFVMNQNWYYSQRSNIMVSMDNIARIKSMLGGVLGEDQGYRRKIFLLALLPLSLLTNCNCGGLLANITCDLE